MKPLNYIISIPEPCHEDWNSMTPDANGKFCHSCSKSVIDFTNKTDAEIHTMLMERKNEKVCGHFKKTQVNRPLALTIPFHTLPRNLPPARAFAIALFFVFGTFLFSCTNEHNQKIDEITVTVPERYTGITMGEPMMPLISETIDSVNIPYHEGTSICSSSIVSGDISYEEVPIIDSLPEVMVQETSTSITTIEYRTLGMISYRTVEPIVEKDTTSSDRQLNSETIKPDTNTTFRVYPNPTNGNFNISYEVMKRGNVQVDIFDINGILVKTLVSQQNQYEGKYIIPTDVSNLIDGIYVCRIINNGVEKSTKLIIAK
jgi:hypothetical protein